MEAYQRRVVRERRELEEKSIKLSNFIGLNTEFGTHDPRRVG